MPQLWLVSLPKVKGKAELSNNIVHECPLPLHQFNLQPKPIVKKSVKLSSLPNKIYERGIFEKVEMKRNPMQWYKYNPAMFTKVHAGIFENPPFDENPFIYIMRG